MLRALFTFLLCANLVNVELELYKENNYYFILNNNCFLYQRKCVQGNGKIMLSQFKKMARWYKSNYQQVSELVFVLVPYTITKDTLYAVNFNDVHRYSSMLKKSSFFSSAFIENFEKKARETQAGFVRDKKISGPVPYFNRDVIFKTLDLISVLDNIHNFKQVKVGPNWIIVDDTEQYIKVFFDKNGFIDKISLVGDSDRNIAH